jgi:hypothetical protein
MPEIRGSEWRGSREMVRRGPRAILDLMEGKFTLLFSKILMNSEKGC